MVVLLVCLIVVLNCLGVWDSDGFDFVIDIICFLLVDFVFDIEEIG